MAKKRTKPRTAVAYAATAFVQLSTVVAFLSCMLAAQGAVLRAELKPAVLDDPRSPPLGAEAPVLRAPEGPLATAASTRLHALTKDLCSEAEKGKLAFRSAPGKTPAVLAPTKSQVVTIPDGANTVKVLLYCKNQMWYASSASMLKGTAGKETLEFLDADLDGDFFSPKDFMRHGGNAFRPVDDHRLMLLQDSIGQYEIDTSQRAPRLAIKPLPWPAWTDATQRLGTCLVAECRQLGGLSPFWLDENRSSLCRAHANYLDQNKFTFETSVLQTHAEEPDRPGYTKAGADAATKVVISFTGDMTEAVTGQIWSMFHRAAFLGPPDDGMGIAMKVGSLAGIPGYTVFWGNRASIPADGMPICFPAAGSRGSATFCAREAPGVKDDPNFYNTQRGLDVSVTYGKLPLSNIKLELFLEAKGGLRSVPGRQFSHERPVNADFDPKNSSTAFFVADQMLKTATWYMAAFRADLADSKVPFELVWWFETQQ